MAHTKQRVGYFTFEGLDGPRRLFYFHEPLALGLLLVLERAARSTGGDGNAGELDPTVHNSAALEAQRRAATPATVEDLEAAYRGYVEVIKRAPSEVLSAHCDNEVARGRLMAQGLA
jgi:hypothetical protein